MVSDFFPQPKTSEGEHLQLLVSNLSYSSFLGPLLVGQIQRGSIRKHQNLICVGKERNKNFKVSNIQVYNSSVVLSLQKRMQVRLLFWQALKVAILEILSYRPPP